MVPRLQPFLRPPLPDRGKIPIARALAGTGDVNISPWVNNGAVDADVAVAPDRAFSAEIIEVMDKEQVEMRHDEN